MGAKPRSPELMKLFLGGRRIKFAANQTIISTDQALRFSYIANGFVERYAITKSGSYGVQIIYGPTDIFALTLAYKVLLGQDLYNGPETYHYRTLSPTELIMIDEQQLVDAAASNPLLYRDLLAEAGRHLESCVMQLENQSLATAYFRVAHILLFYAKRFGRATSKGRQLDVPLTHETLANVLNFSRETVTQAMVQLRKDKLIKPGRHIVVPDLAKLEEAAYG